MSFSNRYKPVSIALLALVSVMMAGLATAGYRIVSPVGVNDTYRYAVGTMADARGSADNQQWIGCFTNAYAGSYSSATCYATTATGLSRSCNTADANLIQAVRSITSESYIYFQWNMDGTCSYVFIENSSRWKPQAVSGS